MQPSMKMLISISAGDIIARTTRMLRDSLRELGGDQALSPKRKVFLHVRVLLCMMLCR